MVACSMGSPPCTCKWEGQRSAHPRFAWLVVDCGVRLALIVLRGGWVVAGPPRQLDDVSAAVATCLIRDGLLHCRMGSGAEAIACRNARNFAL